MTEDPTTRAAIPTIATARPHDPPGLLLRAVWFIFIGWWLSAVAVGVAYFLCAIIIGIPLGFMLFNQLPLILTLRPRTDRIVTEVRDGVAYTTGGTADQLPSGSGRSGSSSSAGGSVPSTSPLPGRCAC